MDPTTSMSPLLVVPRMVIGGQPWDRCDLRSSDVKTLSPAYLLQPGQPSHWHIRLLLTRLPRSSSHYLVCYLYWWVLGVV